MVLYLRNYKYEKFYLVNGIYKNTMPSNKVSKSHIIAEMEKKIDELEWDVITANNMLEAKTEEANKSHSNNAALREKVAKLEEENKELEPERFASAVDTHIENWLEELTDSEFGDVEDLWKAYKKQNTNEYHKKFVVDYVKKRTDNRYSSIEELWEEVGMGMPLMASELDKLKKKGLLLSKGFMASKEECEELKQSNKYLKEAVEKLMDNLKERMENDE